MDDYWKHVGHTHHIDLEAIRTLCFQLLSMFKASEALARKYDEGEEEAAEEGFKRDPQTDPLMSLHRGKLITEGAKVLLSLAMTLRVYDDHMRNGPRAEEYTAHVSVKGGNAYIGNTSDQDRFDYRDACNKIIHALKMRFLEDHFERSHGDDELLYFTGEVELTGRRGKVEWDARLDVESLVETILDVIAFGYEDAEGEPAQSASGAS